MRKIVLTGLAVLMVLFITACGTKEEDEVLDFHNDSVDTLSPIYEAVEDMENERMMLSDEEVFEQIEKELIPKVEESVKFFENHDPETEPAIEYYGLRKDANDDLVSHAYEFQEVVKGYLDGNLTEDEVDEKLMVVGEYTYDFVEKSEIANERWEEIYDEYGFEELKE